MLAHWGLLMSCVNAAPGLAIDQIDLPSVCMVEVPSRTDHGIRGNYRESLRSAHDRVPGWRRSLNMDGVEAVGRRHQRRIVCDVGRAR
jgi:hypothetical protein